MRGLLFLMWLGVLPLVPGCGKFTSDVDEIPSGDEPPKSEGDGAMDLASCRQAFAEVGQTERESACRLRCEEEALSQDYCAPLVANVCERDCLERLVSTDEECASCILDAMTPNGFPTPDTDCTCCFASVAVHSASYCEPGCERTRACRAVIRASHAPPEGVGPQPQFETRVTFPLETIYELTPSPSGLALAGYDEADDAAVVFATLEGEVNSRYNVDAAARGVLLPQLRSGGHWITSSAGVWISEDEGPPVLREGLPVAGWKLSPARNLAVGLANGQLWLVDTESWESNAYALPEGLETAVSVVWAGTDEFLFNGSTESDELKLTLARLVSGSLSIDWQREYAGFNGAYTGEFFESDTDGGAYRLAAAILTRFGTGGDPIWSTPVLGREAVVARSGAVYVAGTDGYPQFAHQEQVDPLEGCSVYGCAAASLEKYSLAGSLDWHSIRRQEPSEVLVLGLIPDPAMIVKTFDGVEFATKLLVFDL